MAASLIESGFPPQAARAAAEKAAERVRADFSGLTVYFPQGLGYNLARRNAELRRRLAAGENREALRREFKLSDVRLRQIEADATPTRGRRDTPMKAPQARR